MDSPTVSRGNERSADIIVSVTGAEMSSALSRKFRRGDISPSVYHNAMNKFEGDFRYRYSRIRVTYAVVSRAMELAKRHPLRGYDAIQLAAALELKEHLQSISSSNFTFLSADDVLCQIAATEGLLVENPNHYP